MGSLITTHFWNHHLCLNNYFIILNSPLCAPNFIIYIVHIVVLLNANITWHTVISDWNSPRSHMTERDLKLLPRPHTNLERKNTQLKTFQGWWSHYRISIYGYILSHGRWTQMHMCSVGACKAVRTQPAWTFFQPECFRIRSERNYRISECLGGISH